MTTWRLSQRDGRLTVQTGVEGRAARFGHRLTIAMRTWSAEVDLDGLNPRGVRLAAAVADLEVLSGEGGVKGLSSTEKSMAARNAISFLGADEFPEITFETSSVQASEGGFLLTGGVTIRGRSLEMVVPVAVGGQDPHWQLRARVPVKQSDFGIRPFSLMAGSLRVADEVTVGFEATLSRPD